jgi:hypothetical protein
MQVKNDVTSTNQKIGDIFIKDKRYIKISYFSEIFFGKSDHMEMLLLVGDKNCGKSVSMQ